MWRFFGLIFEAHTPSFLRLQSQALLVKTQFYSFDLKWLPRAADVFYTFMCEKCYDLQVADTRSNHARIFLHGSLVCGARFYRASSGP